jgi:hypothetical protein
VSERETDRCTQGKRAGQPGTERERKRGEREREERGREGGREGGRVAHLSTAACSSTTHPPKPPPAAAPSQGTCTECTVAATGEKTAAPAAAKKRSQPAEGEGGRGDG